MIKKRIDFSMLVDWSGVEARRPQESTQLEWKSTPSHGDYLLKVSIVDC